MDTMSNLQDEAVRLANRPYRVIVFLDETTDGEPAYIALTPELEGCVSDGDTPDEAIRNLNEARIDFIYFLLQDGLEVPEPQWLSNHTTFFVSEFMQDYAESAGDAPRIYENKPDYLLEQGA
jgi:predicted RNase H-like HicB family nuclease